MHHHPFPFIHNFYAALTRVQASLRLEEEKRAAEKADVAYAAQVSKFLQKKAAADLQRQREKRAEEMIKVKSLQESLWSAAS
jgi:hypothetical protein